MRKSRYESFNVYILVASTKSPSLLRKIWITEIQFQIYCKGNYTLYHVSCFFFNQMRCQTCTIYRYYTFSCLLFVPFSLTPSVHRTAAIRNIQYTEPLLPLQPSFGSNWKSHVHWVYDNYSYYYNYRSRVYIEWANKWMNQFAVVFDSIQRWMGNRCVCVCKALRVVFSDNAFYIGERKTQH